MQDKAPETGRSSGTQLKAQEPPSTLPASRAVSSSLPDVNDMPRDSGSHANLNDHNATSSDITSAPSIQSEEGLAGGRNVAVTRNNELLVSSSSSGSARTRHNNPTATASASCSQSSSSSATSRLTQVNRYSLLYSIKTNVHFYYFPREE